MRSVRQKHTSPELEVRRALHALGYRFRLHRKDLPGRPDIVLPKHRTAVFVHGCFWHRHSGCSKSTTPKTRHEFWNAKFERNKARDAESVRALENMGWKVGVVWECEAHDPKTLNAKIKEILSVR